MSVHCLLAQCQHAFEIAYKLSCHFVYKEAALRVIDSAICVVVTVIEVFLSLFLIFCAHYLHNMIHVRTFLHFQNHEYT